ncbi:hypothetical protein CK203_086217 [Vitis vinifera]|uniref:Uncharacterized protein n=1 Tax=Vitis vinifera TaxID=29760 RepID=A0A438DXG7_VITVI|nr:hypothetical protein CK203_086217 [Vitis vinifera]
MGQPNSEPSKGLVGVGRPILKNLKGVRASNGRLSVGGEQEGNLFGSHLGSLRLAREISLFSTPSGWDGESVVMARVSDWGKVSEAEGGAAMGPLRMILADGREVEVSDLAGRESGTSKEASEGVSERVSQEDEEERVEEGELCWHSSSLAKFSRYLGMPTEGFEGEILFCLKE